MISYSDDNLTLTHLARHLGRCIRAASEALIPRLLTNTPPKGAAIAIIWRREEGVLRARSHQFELWDQGVLVPLFTLRSHVSYLGFELCILVGYGWPIKRIRTAIQKAWYGALRNHMRAITCRTVHEQIVIGTVNHLAQVNPPPPVLLGELDAKVTGSYKRKCSWATRHSGAAVRAANGGRFASISHCATAHHTASMLCDLNSRLFPARATTREQLIHAYAHPLEAGTEYSLLRRNLARLQLTLVAVAPLGGRRDDPQLQRLEELGMPRAPPWRPPLLERVPALVHIDESQGLQTGAVAIVAAAPTGKDTDWWSFGLPSHVTARESMTLLAAYAACFALHRPEIKGGGAEAR
eukprot:gene668-4223_t